MFATLIYPVQQRNDVYTPMARDRVRTDHTKQREECNLGHLAYCHYRHEEIDIRLGCGNVPPESCNAANALYVPFKYTFSACPLV